MCLEDIYTYVLMINYLSMSDLQKFKKLLVRIFLTAPQKDSTKFIFYFKKLLGVLLTYILPQIILLLICTLYITEYF